MLGICGRLTGRFGILGRFTFGRFTLGRLLVKLLWKKQTERKYHHSDNADVAEAMWHVTKLLKGTATQHWKIKSRTVFKQSMWEMKVNIGSGFFKLSCIEIKKTRKKKNTAKKKNIQTPNSILVALTFLDNISMHKYRDYFRNKKDDFTFVKAL